MMMLVCGWQGSAEACAAVVVLWWWCALALSEGPRPQAACQAKTNSDHRLAGMKKEREGSVRAEQLLLICCGGGGGDAAVGGWVCKPRQNMVNGCSDAHAHCISPCKKRVQQLPHLPNHKLTPPKNKCHLYLNHLYHQCVVGKPRYSILPS